MKNNKVEMAEKVSVDCPAQDRINEYCSCPKTDCPRHGRCCECISDHRHRENVKMIVRFPHCLRELVQKAVDEGD